MGLILNGNAPSKMLYNGAEVSLYFNGSKIWPESSPTPSFDEVTIGTQTWMNKNLAIDDGQGGITASTINYGQGDVIEYYYDWDAANRIANSVSGWRLPTSADFTVLKTYVDNSASVLKSTYGWSGGNNGTDDYDFTLLPAGSFSNWGYNTRTGKETSLWSTTTYYDNTYAYLEASYDNSALKIYGGGTANGFSVRLIKDS